LARFLEPLEVEQEFVDEFKYFKVKKSRIDYNEFIDGIENGSIKVENWGNRL
jgi:hypothetical protein